MGIEHIQFLNCDACGSRFRDHGQGRVGSRILCDSCRTMLGGRTGVAPAAGGAVGDLVGEVERTLAELELITMRDSFAFSPDEGIGSADPPSGESGTGDSVAEIAARIGTSPKGERRLRSHRRDWEHSRRHNRNDRLPRESMLRRLRWPIYVALALLLLVAAAVTVWKLRLRGKDLKPAPLARTAGGASETLPVPDLPAYEVARDLALRFVAEEDPREVLKMIRQWPGCLHEVTAFLADNPPVEGVGKLLTDMPPVIRPDVVYQGFGLVLPSGIGRLVLILETADGPKVDFKAYAEWCSVPGKALLDGEVDHADEVRAILRPSTYYNYEFSDSDRYLAFGATLGGGTEQLTIYVMRASAEAEQLTRAIDRIGMHPATFSLQAVGESHKRRQYLLTGLLAIGFVVPEAGSGGE